MKSVSWIEFLVTFIIFLFIFVYIFNDLINFRINYIKNFYNLYYFQEGYLISMGLYNYNISSLNNFVLNDKYYSIFNISIFPTVIYLTQNDTYSCNINSVCIYYNSSEYLEIDQIAENNASESQISISFFQIENDQLNNITTGNISIYCYPLYQFSFLSNSRSFYECIMDIYGNSSITFYPVDNYIVLLSYKSFLKLYNNNEIIYNPLNYISSYYTYYTFLYKNGTLFYSYINLE